MSEKVFGAVNQQGSRPDLVGIDPSETTRRTPLRGEIKAYLLGALHDGTFSSNRRFRFSQKGTGWLKTLKRLLKKIGYSSWMYREGKDRDVHVLETLASFLDFRFDPLRLKSREEQKAYIRGFFDAEGGVPHHITARLYIQLVQKDKAKICKLKQMLKKMSIVCGKVHNPSKRVDPDYWRIFVRANSLQDFIRVIGSWHPAKQKILSKRVMI
ncbi:hypothetical protein EPN28_01690 [Patescibacteria group bacterium]|nr:MAG: hypothetical protein EPN28_01690 [Patescibacteria group bacterium]